MWQKIKNYYHFLQAFISALYFNFPSQKITVIGVTGTDGKTTTVAMTYDILKKAGRKVSMISSNGAKIDGKDYNTGLHISTPNPWLVQKFLKEAVDAGSEYFVIEATSHGLDQNRLAFVNFEIGIITNITHEHLDYHKNWASYAAAKLKLLKNSKVKILNLDDGSYGLIKEKIDGKILTYSLNKKADFNLNSSNIHLNVDGLYNLSNALAACAAASLVGVPKAQILKALSNFKGVKGRFEKVELGQNFKVYIDFAHTPNGLENVLTTLKSKLPKGGKLIAVFGAAAKRDVAKRPIMGKVAAQIADIVILTSEDPRDEDPEKICKEIAIGIKNKALDKDYYIIVNRKKAIEFAVEIAQKSDIVGLFGKGHEQSMAIGKKETSWDEFEVASLAIKRRLQDKKIK